MNGNKNGYGKDFYADGGIFEGIYVDNKRNGKGILKYANQSVFQGDFVNNSYNGFGVKTYSLTSSEPFFRGGNYTG